MNKIRQFSVIALLSFSNIAIANLVTAPWTVTGTDDAGGIWGESLTFETQVANGGNYDLTGFFYWVGSGNQSSAFGRENFTGTLFADNSLQLNGVEIISPSNRIIRGVYSGVLSTSGTEILNGRWGPLGPDGAGIPGSWSAVQAVPIPAAIWLFGSGLIGLLSFARRHSPPY